MICECAACTGLQLGQQGVGQGGTWPLAGLQGHGVGRLAWVPRALLGGSGGRAAVAVLQSLSHARLFRNPVNCGPPGSAVHGIFQARILESIAISFSRGSSPRRDQTRRSCNGRQILYP